MASCRLVSLSIEAVRAEKRQQNRKFLRKITRDGVNTANWIIPEINSDRTYISEDQTTMAGFKAAKAS